MGETPVSELRSEVLSPDDTVLIRQLRLEDAQRYFDLIEFDRAHLSQSYANPDVHDTTADNYKTVEDVIESIENPKPDKYRFGIWDGDTMVGTNNLTRLDEKTVESGSWVGKQYAGHHYASRGRTPLLDFAFNDLQAEKVVSKILIGNEASRKSIEASGYKYAGEDDEGHWVYEMTEEDYGSRANS